MSFRAVVSVGMCRTSGELVRPRCATQTHALAATATSPGPGAGGVIVIIATCMTSIDVLLMSKVSPQKDDMDAQGIADACPLMSMHVQGNADDPM